MKEKTKRQDGFRRGAGGVFKCRGCGKQTRATNETLGFKTCPPCYEIGGMLNGLSDGNVTVAEFMATCESLKGFDAELHLDSYAQHVIKEALEWERENS